MRVLAVLLGLAAAASATAQAGEGENPIRRIVTMLQNMQVEIEKEGEESKEMYEKFMCFCETNLAQTTKEIEEGTELVAQLESSIKEFTGQNAQIAAELAELQEEVDENTKSIEEQSGVRKEEADKFSAESTETKNSIAAIDKALPALEKGVSLEQQKVLLAALQPLAKDTPHEADISSLLQSGQLTAGSTDTIIGILKQMTENFKGNLKDMIQDEEKAIAKFEELTRSKNGEISAANKEIDGLKEREAANKQGISESKEELEKATMALTTNQDRLVKLKKNCSDKTAEYDAATKGRQIELEAIGAAVKILNDDSALDLFKKTVPSPSLVQADKKTDDPAAAAWEQLQQMSVGPVQEIRPVSFVELQMTAEAKPALEPVIKLVGDMKVQLGAEQDDDDKQKDFCKDSIAENEEGKAKKVGEVNLVSQFLKELGNKQKAIEEQITGLQDEIGKLEKALEEATTQRAEEKKVFLKVSAEQNAAIAIIEKAKEVLGAAYGPKSFAQTGPAPAPQDQSVADMLGLSFVQTKEVGQGQMNELDSLLLQVGADAGLQGKVAQQQTQPTDRTKQGGGIMALMDEMKHDLELELAELKHDEDESQADFDKLTEESNKSIKQKKKEITGRQEAKARVDEKVDIQTNVKKGYDEEVESIDAKLTALHGQCDFLLENYDERKKARSQEIEGLSKSSAVLQGAKLDLHQQKTSLRGA
jgi:chromosome segregation ATPase